MFGRKPKTDQMTEQQVINLLECGYSTAVECITGTEILVAIANTIHNTGLGTNHSMYAAQQVQKMLVEVLNEAQRRGRTG